jgi:predicted  nucleic acid-binding Zn-ribbon protein
VSREQGALLLRLQRADLKVEMLRARLASLPEQKALEEVEEELGRVERERGEAEEELARLAREIRKLEGDAWGIRKKAESEEERLLSGEISNPREAASVQAEVESLKRRAAGVEELLLGLMVEREELETRIGRLKARQAELSTKRGELASARDRAAAEVGEALEEAEARRAEEAAAIPGELLAYYEELRRMKGGVAVASVEGGVCGGCRLSLSPVFLEEVAASSHLLRCEHCGRLLVP